MKRISRRNKALRGLLVGSMLMALASVTNILLAADNRPHQHGVGELNIVIDDHDLFLEVRLPAADLIGFEHSPSSEDQKSKVKQTLASFQTGATWFEPSPQAQCALESAQASLVGFNTEDSVAKTSAHAAAKHQHKKSHSHDHDHGHKHKHAHKHSDSDHAADTHSDFEGSMQFHCEMPGKLEALAALVFKSYPSISSLRVQLITSTSQISRELTPEASVLAINP